MMMKVLVPAFFSRKDTKTPMYAAIAALILNVLLNYIFAFKLGYGHTGLALASSVAAILSVSILFVILVKEKYIQYTNPFNRFNFALIVASFALVQFLMFGPFNIDFSSLSFVERLVNLSLEIFISILIYLGISRIIVGKNLKELF